MTDWNLVGYIKASNYRLNILTLLSKGNKIPIEIKNELKLYITHISTILKELGDKGLVKCLTPNLKKGKIYTITTLGKEILNQILSGNE